MDENEAPVATPPLTLVYLLVWAALCAGMFELARQDERFSDHMVSDVYWGVTIAVYAAGILGMALRIGWWWQGRLIAWQPGHWLLCLTGVLGILHVLIVEIRDLILHYDPVPTGLLYVIEAYYAYGLMGVAVLALVVAMIATPVHWGWRLTILPKAVRQTASLGLALLSAAGSHGTLNMAIVIVSGWIFLISPLPILAVTFWDAAQNARKRDWLHWAGCACWTMIFMTEVLLNLAYMVAGFP